jgi:hypothetical protein
MPLTLKDQETLDAIQMMMDGKIGEEEVGRLLEKSQRQV